MQVHAVILTIFCLVQIELIHASALTNANISAVCESHNKTCLSKCCPMGEALKRSRCVFSNSNSLDITVYDAQLKPTNKSMEDVFQLVPARILNETFRSDSIRLSHLGNTYLTEDGNVYVEMPNQYHRWLLFTTEHFCVDNAKQYHDMQPVIIGELESVEPYINYNLEYVGVVTIVLFLLTILPYAIYPQLRDRNGVILITFIACSVVPMFIRVLQYLRFSPTQAVKLAMFYHFCMVSSFCWTNVMFYRIRRASMQSIGIPEVGIKQWLKYGAYAVGLPQTLTIIVAVIELNDLSHIPWFVTPQILDGGNITFQAKESLFYLYTPLLLILAYNWVICITNVFPFYKSPSPIPMRPMENDTDSLKSPLKRPSKYVALLILLTIYCIVHLLLMFTPYSAMHRAYLEMVFTIFFGIAMFIIFVVNKEVLAIAKEFHRKRNNSNDRVSFKRGDVTLQ